MNLITCEKSRGFMAGMLQLVEHWVHEGYTLDDKLLYFTYFNVSMQC